MVREVFVAETDEAAWRLSVGSMMGRMMREYFLPLLAGFGFLEFLKHDPEVPDSDVTPEYCAKHNWLIGSPATVAEKLEAVYEEVGGFSQLLLFVVDCADNPQVWKESLGLLPPELMPRVKQLAAKPATAVASGDRPDAAGPQRRGAVAAAGRRVRRPRGA